MKKIMSTLPEVVHTVSPDQIVQYAQASGDHNPLHLDSTFAQTTQFGETIAHGMLAIAFLSEMMTKAFGEAWLNSGHLKVRLKAPVYPGDTVITEGTLQNNKSDSTQLFYDVRCHNQRRDLLITGYASICQPGFEQV